VLAQRVSERDHTNRAVFIASFRIAEKMGFTSSNRRRRIEIDHRWLSSSLSSRGEKHQKGCRQLTGSDLIWTTTMCVARSVISRLWKTSQRLVPIEAPSDYCIISCSYTDSLFRFNLLG
jgi:hypothetical protein